MPKIIAMQKYDANKKVQKMPNYDVKISAMRMI